MAAAARAAAAVRAARAAAGVARRPAARGAQCMCTLRMRMHMQGAMFTCVPMSRCPDVPMHAAHVHGTCRARSWPS